MQTMHTTLLIGPADWNAERMPRAAFEERLAVFWQESAADGAIIYGDAAEHGALSYLTNFTPKLEAAVAFIPRAGAPTLLVGGGVNMIAAARPLTWVEGVQPLRQLGKFAADWVATLPGSCRISVIGGDSMPYATRNEMDWALAGICTLQDGSEVLHAQMRRKDRREIAAMRGACERLDQAATALRRAHYEGASASRAMLAAEHVAQLNGAQDVRSLFSLDCGRTLRPFDGPSQDRVDPLQAYVAVRYAGYWAEGFVRAVCKADPVGERARTLLDALISAAAPGRSSLALAQAVATSAPHPMTADIFGNGIGLSLQEPPLLCTTATAMLVSGGVYSLRTGILEGEGAIASAVLRITQNGNEVLWSSLSGHR
jgi:hypothetical protein